VIELERIDGSDGDIACFSTTVNDVDLLPGKQQAVENKDFVPFTNREIKFARNVVSVRIEIEMPDCEVDEKGEEEPDVVSFAIKIHSPSPDGVKLSRKVMCFIDIEPDNTEEDKRIAKERELMIDYFIQHKEISWGQ
jgi:hypothetical protein